jgi:glycerol-3-phosphate O-acyltransferase
MGFTLSTHLLINPSHRSIDKALMGRIDALLDGMSDEGMHQYLADTVYLERQRFYSEGISEGEDAQLVESLAHGLHEGSSELRAAAGELVRGYSHEIHNRFSERTFGAAMKLAPAALKRLLAPSAKGVWRWPELDPGEHIQVQGPTEQIRRLAETHTLIVAPTHLSNLDSPLVGYALHMAGLPPCTYGAGLNLFTNPAMSFFMSRLGAYTVDRRKRHRLYKDVLKAYSTELISRGAHSLFYPGGTRSRTGCIESHVKRGLLGTGIAAWQEGLRSGEEHRDVLVVPCTLSCSLVLEAETLISDALAAEGKSRYIITDDEFSHPTTVLKFVRKLMDLDVSVVVRFGTPLDLIGNPVDEDGRSLDGQGRPFDRRKYVCDRSGAVVRDAQRDRVYTNHLASALCRAYQRDSAALPTHVAAYAGWMCLAERYPKLDVYQRVLLAPFERWVDRNRLLAAVDTLLLQIDARVAAGQLQAVLPSGPDRTERVLTDAVAAFSRFHSHPALSFEDWRVLVDPKLSLYYGNRLVGAGLNIGSAP